MKKYVEAAVTPTQVSHPPELLLRHCLSLGATAEPKQPPRVRLEQALGPELAQRLLSALAPPSRH